MQKKFKKLIGLVVLFALAVPTCWAQEKAFTEIGTVLARTNITLHTANVPVLLFAKRTVVNVRVISLLSNTTSRIRLYLTTSTTASSTVTNDLTTGKGCINMGWTNSVATTPVQTEKVFSRQSPLGLWTGYIYVATPDSTGTVNGVEFGY